MRNNNLDKRSNERQQNDASERTQNCEEKKQFTEVKNAHASGIGSMGRNDEKLADHIEHPDESDDRNDVY